MAVINKKSNDEPLDRNKSTLTHKLTALAVGHLTVIGCKPIETEVQVAPGWIADVAGFTYPTMTEMKLGKLLKRVVMNQPLLDELNTGRKDYYASDYIAQKHLFPLTAIVEVKISMADFKRDIYKKFNTNVANLNYIILPKSIYRKASDALDIRSHYKPQWSFLIASDDGERIVKSCIPRIESTGIGQSTDIIAQIAIRRCHRTRYVFMRSTMKQYRAEGKL